MSGTCKVITAICLVNPEGRHLAQQRIDSNKMAKIDSINKPNYTTGKGRLTHTFRWIIDAEKDQTLPESVTADKIWREDDLEICIKSGQGRTLVTEDQFIIIIIIIIIIIGRPRWSSG